MSRSTPVERGEELRVSGSHIFSTRSHNDFVPSDPPVPAELLMMRRTPRQLPATLRQPSGSSARLSRQKLPLGWYHRLCVRTERAASELDRSKWDPCLAFEKCFFLEVVVFMEGVLVVYFFFFRYKFIVFLLFWVFSIFMLMEGFRLELIRFSYE